MIIDGPFIITYDPHMSHTWSIYYHRWTIYDRIHAHVLIQAHFLACLCMCMCACSCECRCKHMLVYVNVCVCACASACVHAKRFVLVCMCMCTLVCGFVCGCVLVCMCARVRSCSRRLRNTAKMIPRGPRRPHDASRTPQRRHLDFPLARPICLSKLCITSPSCSTCRMFPRSHQS